MKTKSRPFAIFFQNIFFETALRVFLALNMENIFFDSLFLADIAWPISVTQHWWSYKLLALKKQLGQSYEFYLCQYHSLDLSNRDPWPSCKFPPHPDPVLIFRDSVVLCHTVRLDKFKSKGLVCNMFCNTTYNIFYYFLHELHCLWQCLLILFLISKQFLIYSTENFPQILNAKL